MKKILLLLVFVLISCSKDEANTNSEPDFTLPTITISNPTFSPAEFKFYGNVTSVGSGYSSRGFCWGLNINPIINNNNNQYLTEFTNTAGNFFLTKPYGTDFTPLTTYYVRAYVQANNGDVVYSENITFVTPPKMNLTGSAKKIHTTSLTLSGTVMVNQLEPILPDKKGFCYRTSSGVTVTNGQIIEMNTSDYATYELTPTNLLSNTIYYAKAYVREGASIYYSDEFQFKTAGAIGTSGGYIFYDKGEYSDGWRYLEAAPNNLTYNGSDKILWGCMGTAVNQTQASMGFGPSNTARIISQCSSANCAARLCDNYSINGLSDWFLPSDEELFAFYKSANNVYTIANASTSAKYFWSSTEFNNNEARILDAYDGYLWDYDKNYNLVRVRPVRRF